MYDRADFFGSTVASDVSEELTASTRKSFEYGLDSMHKVFEDQNFVDSLLDETDVWISGHKNELR